MAAGILLSRIAGLARQRVFASFFGNSAAADAFSAAFKIPNFLQNLFGEGVLSASFIPVYASLLARGDQQGARRVANAIASLLALISAALVLAGVLATPLLIDLIAPGFQGATRALTIRLVRILFPGAGLLVLSAWCLGVLNSHRRFLLSYSAPVLWNVAIIAALLVYGPVRPQFPLAEIMAWGAVVGSALQLLVQLPAVVRLLGGVRPVFDTASAGVRAVITNFVPVFIGRGVVQISAYVDALLASYLPVGAVSGLYYAQILYTLPVSLFGMSVSAAELPVMSSVTGSRDAVADMLRRRLDEGLRRIALFVVPSAVAFLALGDVVAGALYQTGDFTRSVTVYVWGILAGSAVGLLASTLGRLYASTFYALHDTRTPLRFAMLRVALTTVLGFLFALPLPPLLGIPQRWGAAGLTISAGIAGWLEFLLLRRAMNARVGRTGLPWRLVARLWAAALGAAALGWGIKLAAGSLPPLVLAVLVLPPFGIAYFALTSAMGVAEARELARRVLGLARR